MQNAEQLQHLTINQSNAYQIDPTLNTDEKL